MAKLTGMDKVLNEWEWPLVHHRDARPVSIPEAQAIVAHVFQLAGIAERAPTVVRLESHEAGYVHGASAYVNHEHTGMVLQSPLCTTSVVLHECAHLLTDDPLDVMELRAPQEGFTHGPLWLSNYLWLLHRLMGPSYNTFYLRSTMPAALRPMDINFYPTIRGTPRSDLA